MRVIAGSCRSLPLVSPEGEDTRPTTDRIKETLFNMIQSDIPDCVFYDFFSGSGGIGIEALSRGAKHAYFVENNKQALDCIKKNLNFSHDERINEQLEHIRSVSSFDDSEKWDNVIILLSKSVIVCSVPLIIRDINK